MENVDNRVQSSSGFAEDGVGISFGPCLPACSFEIPSEIDNETELWSIRVPVDCDITQVFHGKTLTMRGHNSISSTANQNIVCTLSDVDGDIAHALIQDEGVDFQSHRVLSKVIDDDIDESETMRPLYKFDRSFHFLQDSSIVQSLLVLNQHQVDKKFAPNAVVAPAPEAVVNIETPSKEMRRGSRGSKAFQQQVHSFRAAYESVPQKTNLKRRWKPSGSAAVYVPQEHLQIQLEHPYTSKEEKVVKTEKPEESNLFHKKEKKRLKKMAKKLKKERKSKREENNIIDI